MMTSRKHAPLKKKYYDTTTATLWRKNFERKSWKDLNSKISITKREITKIGPFIKKQRNYCLSLLRKTKKAYFEKLNIKEIGYNKTFWKTVRPNFSDKDNKSSKITLVENNIVIADKKRVSELMNKYFINITKNLNLKAPIINTTDDIQSLTKNYDNHISIRKIVPDSFNFKSVSLDDVKKEVLNLNPKKSSTSGTIPEQFLNKLLTFICNI